MKLRLKYYRVIFFFVLQNIPSWQCNIFTAHNVDQYRVTAIQCGCTLVKHIQTVLIPTQFEFLIPVILPVISAKRTRPHCYLVRFRRRPLSSNNHRTSFGNDFIRYKNLSVFRKCFHVFQYCVIRLALAHFRFYKSLYEAHPFQFYAFFAVGITGFDVQFYVYYIHDENEHNDQYENIAFTNCGRYLGKYILTFAPSNTAP